ncbi:penicillin-binding protein 1C [Desulfovibrio falkowii]|uniref:penicillin-binding protein 1C n=1 Tax=Desulfovibrio falkowii TaxID=3136602 RepID=UPI0038B39304
MISTSFGDQRTSARPTGSGTSGMSRGGRSLWRLFRPARWYFASLIAVLGAALLWLHHAPCKYPLDGIGFSRVVYDGKGGLMRLSLSKDQKYRIRTRLSDIPPAAVDSVLRYEDRYYWQHPGVNVLALARAGFGLLAGRRIMGGSTITMQVARLTHGLETGKIGAKLWQIALALQLEWHFSKEEILEAYFNLAPYGGNVEGLGAAAMVYFHKIPEQLTPGESTALMLVPQNPVRRRPAGDNTHFMDAFSRLEAVWHGRQEHAPLRVYGPENLPFTAPHLSTELLQQDGSDTLHTTLDPASQRRLERQLRLFTARRHDYGLVNGAAMLLHWPSMEVRALAGSADFFNAAIMGQVDGTRARRSPGSTLKPFIYALALDQGLIHPLTLLADTPRSFSGYDPENYDGSFRGPVSASEALRASRNVPAIALAARLRQPGFYEFLSRAGVNFASGEEHYGLSLVLGGAEVSMRELAGLYAMLANKGVWRPLRMLQGDRRTAIALPLLSPEASYVALAMLEDGNPDRLVRSQGGTVLPLRLKTGTSNGFRDAWAAGIVGPYVLVVWLGNFDNKPNPLLVGGISAVPLFTQIARDIAMAEPLQDYQAEPAHGLNLERVEVCAATGDLDTSLCEDTVKTWFIPGVSPLASSGVFRPILIDRQTGLRACMPQADRTEVRIWEFWPTDMAQMFARAGMPKPEPPPFALECGRENMITGEAPRIVLPKDGLTYKLSLSSPGHENMVFMAHADAGVKTLHWFVNGRYLGKGVPGEVFLWRAVPGDIELRVVDDAGRAGKKRVRVHAVP